MATLHGFVRIFFTPKDLFQNVSVTFLLQEMEDGNAIVLQNEIVEADGSTHLATRSSRTVADLQKLGKAQLHTKNSMVLEKRKHVMEGSCAFVVVSREK